MHGFVVWDYASEFDSACEVLAQWVGQGKIKTRETIVRGGLPMAEQALAGLFEGINTGE